MAEAPKPQRWWQTLPGVLTAIAAMLTAVTGLIVALHQAGMFHPAAKHPPQTQHTRTPPEPTPPPAVPETGPSAATPLVTGQTLLAPLPLAAGAEVRVGSAVYTILAAQLERYDVEKRALRFTVRMMNNERYPANFWDASFRLLVDGVPRAPISDLNKVVHGHSAEDGDVVFVIPVATQATVLQVRHENEVTALPVDLSTKPKAAEPKP